MSLSILKGIQKLGGDIWKGSGASDAWEKNFGGGNWMRNDLFRFTGLPGMIEDFDKSWGGGNWMNRVGLGGGGDDDIDTSSSSGSGSGSTETGNSSMEQDQNSPEEERARLDAIRRMLAGRYGRAETNLTGGAGYGSGSGRSIGGYSG